MGQLALPLRCQKDSPEGFDFPTAGVLLPESFVLADLHLRRPPTGLLRGVLSTGQGLLYTDFVKGCQENIQKKRGQPVL